MAQKNNRLILSLFIMLLLGVFLAGCANQSQAIEAQETTPSPIVTDALAAVTVPPAPSPTLAAPIISVTTAAVEPTAVPLKPSPQPSSTSDIVMTETAVIPSPTMSPPTAPLPTPSGSYSWTLRVPILMYHHISVPPADADIYRTDLSVTPGNFREQMAYLAENGYESIDLYQLSAAITAKSDLPEKPVILTFDDGYLDNYENAFPILQEFGFTGSFFVLTDMADQGAEGYANWEQLEEMAAAGMRIESHSKNHPDLTTQSRDSIIFQVLGSQETIAAHTGYTPRYFVYPSGRYNPEIMQILAELDLWGAATTQGGVWHGFEERYEWSRQRMRYDTTLAEFILFVDPDGTVGGKTPDEK